MLSNDKIMKTKSIFLCLLAGTLLLGQSGCAVRTKHAHKPPKTMPPGPVKKATGSPSAAPYAPGHRK